MDGGSDSEPDDVVGTAAQDEAKVRKERQYAKFSEWFSQRLEADTAEQIKPASDTLPDDELSTRLLLARHEQSVRAHPREYQMELFERAKHENIIAVLDTGSGKTLIAVLLLQWVLERELEARERGEAKRIAFFLVDNVTLVFQQAAVLECNLDYKVERFCGAMGCDLWSKSVWENHFKENMVIVCTAEVLYQCLMHSYVKMEQISLLIFDEAHHTKKSHPYARIMNDFYMRSERPSKRPRIFGMTASPVDAKTDVVEGAKELESLLHCHIATTSDLSLLQKAVYKPNEEVAFYNTLPVPFETPLAQQLRSKFGHLKAFRRLFAYAKACSAELGPWAADEFWRFALRDEEQRRAESRLERAFRDLHGTNRSRSGGSNVTNSAETKGDASAEMAKLDEDIRCLQEAASIATLHPWRSPSLESADLSSKVLKLHEYLELYYSGPTDARCIVFVNQRWTARLLHEILNHIGSPYLRSAVLVGTSTGASDLRISFRQQIVTMLNFRKGDTNCLFCTSVAEEGLDIPDCNLVVRFDLYTTMIKYIQSRGRARHKNSKFLHMIEYGNKEHQERVLEVRKAEFVMRSFCQNLPEDRLLRGFDADFNAPHLPPDAERTFTDPDTGAKLTYAAAHTVLDNLMARLPQRADAAPGSLDRPCYTIVSSGRLFVCEVTLPPHCPLGSAVGPPCNRKAVAKRAAAFQACKRLYDMKCLDKHFVPVYQKELPAMRNALLALNSKKCNEYAMRLKPKAWGERGTVPERLWLNVIDLDQGALGRTHQPLGLLTRQQMPDFPSFAVFPVNEKPEMVAVTSAKKSFVIEQELLEKLTTFTLRVYRDVFNKLFENDSAKMSYWIAPLKSSSIAPELDMETINAVEENEEYPWTPDMPHEFLAGKFLVDKWDGGRRFHTKGVAPQYRPEDPVPANTAKGRFNNSILDYSISLFKQSRERVRDCWSLTQPVIEADKIIHRRNLLAPPDQKESSVSRCFVCPQPLKISAIPTAFAAMTLVFPAVIHRLESYLVSLDACKLVDLVGIPPTLALEAVTKDSDNQDDRFGTVVLNFRPGMGPNYERLEFLGDCFLKLATTLSTFGQNPNDDEFHFHVKRMELLCNKNLFETAKKLRLHEYVRSAAFSRRTWYPEGLRLLEGKGHKNADGTGMAKHALGDKSLADVCEALIGAAFLAHNGQQGELWRPDRWTEAVKAVTAFVDSSEHTMRVWRDYEIAYANPLPKYQTEPATAAQRDLVNKIAQEHDYRFKYPRLLRSAFLHPSYPFIWEKVPSYQRLEFLGDALLDMACVSYLFYKFPSKGPQWLTEHKTAMASNKFLGALCVRLGWQRHLKHNHPELLSQIEAYATEVQEAEREAGPGARDYWVGVRSPPKCLPDIVEAYVGAMFIDSGFDYGQVQRFFDGHIRWFFEDMTIYDAFASSHPTTKLHHILSIYLACRDYRLLSKELPALTGSAGRVVAAVLVHGQPIGDGEASSGRYAKIKASIAALEKIEGLAPFEFRERFGCDCPREEGSGGDKKVVGVVKMAEVGTAI